MKYQWVLLVALIWVSPVGATDSYYYGKGEYATISNGRSPDGHWSITAHGDGEEGANNFHLYLFREPTHEKLARLPTGEHLDTGPLSIVGIWSPDSKRVAVLYRSDRHILEFRLFEVTEGKLKPIELPSLVNSIGGRFFRAAVPYELFSRYYRVGWQGPNKLALEEFNTFDASGPVFLEGIDPYLKVERLGAERCFTSFSASAVLDIKEKGKMVISDIKPLPDQERTIVYSPHLIFDSHAGLHNTETTK